MTEAPIPTLFEWAGGMPALDRLTSVFYAKVRSDATEVGLPSDPELRRLT